MRELLLLASIVLGQLTPNAPLLTQVTNRLRLTPGATVTKEAERTPDKIIVKPVKTKIEDYTSTAEAVYSIDLASNGVLTSKAADKRLQIASLTKLMTAYVILKEENNLNNLYTVGALSGQPGDSVTGLQTGEQMSVSGLLEGLLITSGSDAAQVLATGNAGSVDAFVAKMNTAATRLNLVNTHFANPVGWDDVSNYSSAKDMTELTRILLRNKTFTDITSKRNSAVTTSAGRTMNLSTTNQLLGTPGYTGVKTGYTYGAGECLVSLYEEGDKQILTTVIGSSARFAETESIKGWILDAYTWYNMASSQ